MTSSLTFENKEKVTGGKCLAFSPGLYWNTALLVCPLALNLWH